MNFRGDYYKAEREQKVTAHRLRYFRGDWEPETKIGWLAQKIIAYLYKKLILPMTNKK